ncbi:MAG: diacylglycerol kinase [Pirellulaceae bacterium]
MHAATDDPEVNEMNESKLNQSTWKQKFRHAFRGLRVGSRGQSSFLVHIPVACFVLAVAAQVRVSTLEWCILVLCITMVIAAELFNSAIECLAKAVTREYDPYVRDALDIASAAVLVAALGSVVIGAIILGFRFGVERGLWSLQVIG